jgi:glycosyltransferase involved in cell wall biosynthesis
MSGVPEVSVVLPAYNEAKTLGDVIDSIRKTLDEHHISHEIIVVDDASSDNTSEVARSRSVKLIRFPMNRGVGAARKAGIVAAGSHRILTTDADGTYPVDVIPRMIESLSENDMAIGARTGKRVSESWIKKPPKYLIRKLACYLSRRNIPDLNSGLRSFKKETALKYFYLLPEGHSWESTITLAFLCNGHPTEFIRADYFLRGGGHSSFRPFSDTYNYISLVIRTVMYFNPLRIFIPLTLAIGAAGCIKTVYDWNVYHNIGGLDVALLLTTLIVGILGLLADLIVVTHRSHRDHFKN